MNTIPHSTARLLVLALLTATGIVGCGGSADEPNNQGAAPASVPTVEPKPQSQTPPQEPARPPVESGVSAPTVSLAAAAAGGDAEAVRQHIAAGTDLNAIDPASGSTALIAAASLNQIETAMLLIDAGADLEARSQTGATALQTAAFMCREDILRALLAKGADRNAKDQSGATALDSVSGPFEDVRPVYDLLLRLLAPAGLELDYEFLKTARPKMAEILLKQP